MTDLRERVDEASEEAEDGRIDLGAPAGRAKATGRLLSARGRALRAMKEGLLW